MSTSARQRFYLEMRRRTQDDPADFQSRIPKSHCEKKGSEGPTRDRVFVSYHILRPLEWPRWSLWRRTCFGVVDGERGDEFVDP